MKICVVGTGYVGLIVGACLADFGHDVICVDKNIHKIEMLKKAEVPIYEPGVSEIIKRNMDEGRLLFTADLKEAVEKSLIIFIAVGTPSNEDGSVNMDFFWQVVDDIGKCINSYKIVVNKSTVPVGTAEEVKKRLSEKTEQKFDVVSNSEFLKEGSAVDDFMRPDRIIIGTDDVRVAELMKELYSPLVRTGKPILIMDQRSAELTKYAANAMLASRISFVNEMALLAEALGADIDCVRKGIGSDSRIGSSFLFPGLGFGGSCFPKDLKALISMGDGSDVSLDILKAVIAVNRRQRVKFVEKVSRFFKGDLREKKLAIWGLAFKPKTDDVREAPAFDMIEQLLSWGARICAFDPEAIETAKRILGDRISYGKNEYDVLSEADALLIVTEWNEFRFPDFDKMKKIMKAPVVFDGRNIFDLETMKKHGFSYFSIGRQQVSASG